MYNIWVSQTSWRNGVLEQDKGFLEPKQIDFKNTREKRINIFLTLFAKNKVKFND